MPGPATLPAPGAVVGGPVGPGPMAVDSTCQGNSCSPGNVPTEKQKTSLPPYLIEPPDILLLDPIRMIPKPPYLVQPLDALLIRVAEPLPNQPIDGTYTVTPDGTVNLGYSYGQIRVAGYTLEDVERVIRNHLGRVLKDPQIAVGLAQFRGVQQTRGEHLVRMDGTISLGSYGCVYVAGLTLAQAKVAIERHLSQYLLDPEVSVDVFAYNSKSYYVITDGAGYGQQVYRFPVTGNETVLDAISQIQGLPAVASKKKIWLARPAPACHGCSQILPIDWRAITEGGVTATNYQIFPGDRIYVHSDWLICLDNTLNKVLSPIQQVLFTTIFFGAAVNQFKSGGGNNNAGTILAAPVR
ncbi:MAG: polysaccharide biosynthesis/export family protein [Gemmataceae bacterium]